MAAEHCFSRQKAGFLASELHQCGIGSIIEWKTLHRRFVFLLLGSCLVAVFIFPRASLYPKIDKPLNIETG